MPYVFGHVGDGNLHLTVWPASSEAGLLEARSAALVDAIDRLIWSYNGTISAEHGLGQELRDRIVGQKPEIELELMRRIKAAFDPQGLLNPGKLLPDRADPNETN
jgi:FAD/FMN-containing dehydrogenase